MTFDVVDLYAGLGGLGIGFQQAGYNSRGAVDHWAHAMVENARIMCHETPMFADELSESDFSTNGDVIALTKLREYLMSEDAHNRLKEGAPNLHLTKGNLERLRIPKRSDGS